MKESEVGSGALLHSIPATQRMLGLGRTKVYELIRAGDLRTVRVGRRRLVPAAALDDFVARLRHEQDQ